MTTSTREATGAVASLLPPRAKAEGTRGRILVAALELFASRGYHAASIRDIAAHAGLTSGSLYSYFASKEAVLAELVFLGYDEHQRRLLTGILSSGPRPRDQLAALVRAHVLSHTEFPVLAIVATRGLRDLSEAAAAPTVAVSQHSASILSDVIRRGIQSDGFVVGNQLVVEGAIATLGQSVAGWWPRVSHLIAAEDLADEYAVLVLRMVGIGLDPALSTPTSRDVAGEPPVGSDSPNR